jgi:hypothetical protein
MISIADFLERFGNLSMRVVHHRAPYIFEATCILHTRDRAPDHRGAGCTPEEAILNLYVYLDRITAKVA